MRRLGGSSWQIRIRRGDTLTDVALWIRAAERIDVPADDRVPGPLDADESQLVQTSHEPLGPAWLAWWRLLVGEPGPERPPARTAEAECGLAPPDFPGLTPWPQLRRLVMVRWPEAAAWHQARVRAAQGTWELQRSPVDHVVKGVERSLGRQLRAVKLEVLLLPVKDETIRNVGGGRYLVPERVFDSPAWEAWLRGVLERVG